jgi:DNA replication and repair protein RecF
VRLSHLSLRHFRNLGRQELEVPAEGVALVGENAQGKTNLLEAMYYLETFRSFRGARDDQLVEFGEDVFRVAATIGHEREGEGASRVAAAFQRRGRRKKVTVDDGEPERLSDGLGRLGAVVFSPADVALVSGGPAERRRFLDIVLSLNEPGYVRALQEFRQVLSQRNAAIRDEQPWALVQVWDEGLVVAGSRVTWSRKLWVDRHAGAFAAYHSHVSGGQDAVPVYRPSVHVQDAACVADVEQAYRAGLEGARERERRLGATVVGPHRDDLSISLEGERELEVREFGSGGQRRTAALALRLVEARTIREARGVEPIVLLDDVFAELDAGRSERVLALIEQEETGQVILTAPRESDVRLRRDALPRWRITSGRIET